MIKKTAILAAILLVVTLSTTSFAADGASIFASKCTMCHGANASGTVMAPKLSGTELDTLTIRARIANGVSGANKKYPKFAMTMPKFDMPAGDLEALAGYLKSL